MKLDATVDRVVGWQMDWCEILSVQGEEAGAKLECEGDGLVFRMRGRSWQVMRQ